jgi:hypothetical protein
MNDYYSLSQEDNNAAKKYRKDIESRWERPEWYMIEAAFKDGICHAKGIKYDFLSDTDKDFIRSTMNDIKERRKILEDYGR